MKKDIAELWVQALRGGAFEQGQNSLVTADGTYCCLGVLCEVLGAEKVKDGKSMYFEGSGGCLPEVVVDLARLRNRSGVLPNLTSLAHLNDIWRCTFNEIADVIEQNWELL